MGNIMNNKKLFPLFSSFCLVLASNASAEDYVDFTASTNPDSPTPISSWTGTSAESILWKGKGSNSTDSQNCYVLVDTDITAVRFFPSGGGGVHNNVCMTFENGTTFTLTGKNGFEFNDYSQSGISASYAMNYIFSVEEGGTANIDITATQTYNLNLFCLDNNYTGGSNYTTFGKYGRIFSIGDGITFSTAADMNVSGHNPELTEYDSNFILDGKLDVATTLTFNDTILTQGATGEMTAHYIQILNTTATLSGSVISETSLSLGGEVTQTSTGVLKGESIGLNGGNISLGGTVSKVDGSATTLATVGGTTYLSTSGSGLNVDSFLFGGGSLVLQNDMSVDNINAVSGTSSSISTAEGVTLTVTGNSEINDSSYSSDLTLGGKIVFDGTLLSYGTSITIDSGATVEVMIPELTSNVFEMTRSTLTVKGTLLTQSGASSYHKYSTSFLNLTIDGGYFYDSTTALNTSSIRIWGGNTSGQGILSIQNGGKIKTNAGTFLQINSGDIITDGTASIDVGGLMFANGTTTNSVSVMKSSEFVSKPNIFISGGTDMSPTKVTFNLFEGNYQFGSVIILRNGELTLMLNGATVSFDEFIPLGGSTGNMTFVIYDFVENAVDMGNITNDMISGDVINIGTDSSVTLIGYDKNSNPISGEWMIKDGYLYNTGLVPEPAEWAAMISALALLAVYVRRRRN